MSYSTNQRNKDTSISALAVFFKSLELRRTLKSYAWADIAPADHEQAKQAKKSIAGRLTPERIAKAEAMARDD